MTRDSAVVAVLDDSRRRRLCPTSAAADVGVSSPTDGVTAASGSSSSGGGGGGSGGGGCDEGTSSKSSSAASTTTSCCGSSPSASGSDDDDFAAVPRPTTACPTAVRRSAPNDDNDHDDAQPPSCDDATTVVARQQSPSGGRFDDTAPANIGGRLTFYKDGKFIFQLAAHQQHSYNSQSAIMSPCRWVPVPTVIQQHKSGVKRVGQSSSHLQNKTIWPYLVTDQHQPVSNSKSPQPIHQSLSLATMKSGDRRLQQMQLSQSRTTPPPSKPFSGAVNLLGFNNTVVKATTQNIVRRPSRKYSTSTLVENISDLHHQNRQPQSLQLRNSSKLSQHHQNQSFMMVATKAIKALRRSKQHNSCRLKSTGKTELGRQSLRPKSKQPPLENLEHIVRHLWCRRHTSELLRRQLSLNNNMETAISTSPPPASQCDSYDSSCTSMVMGGSKRRSLNSPLSTYTTNSNESRMSTSIEDSSPYKKYKLGQQQQQQLLQQTVANNGAKIGVSTVSANDHSITAILSGNATGTKRGIDVISSIIDSNTCFSTKTTSTYSNSIIMPQKNILPAQPSLLRTLLKSPSSEIVSQSVSASSNDSSYTRHNTFNSRKRSSAELASLVRATEINKCSSITTPVILPPTVGTNAPNNATAPHTTFQLPTLHHPAATDQLTAAGYFNVLYHQAAIAAAMVYQNHSNQLPQPVLKPTPLPKPPLPSALLPSQFSITNGASSSWQQQLNRRPPLLPLSEMVTSKDIAANVAICSSSVSTIVAPRTSPLTTAIVNSSRLMPPNVPSSPPLLKHSIHPHNISSKHVQEHQHQQYQQAPSVHQPSLYHKIKQHQLGSGVKKNIEDCVGYRANMTEKYAVDDKASTSSIDCMPLNLSKDSAVENADSASTTATVR